MAIDKIEGIELAIVFLEELKKALGDDGKVSSSEWLAIAVAVGQRAFQEYSD